MAELLTISKNKLLGLYIRMRTSGTSMDDVIEALQPMAQKLSREERHQLGQEVLQWEEKQKTEPPRIQPLAPLHKAEASQPNKPFGTRFLDPSKLPAGVNAIRPVEVPIPCPKCGRKNTSKDVCCGYCGSSLKSTVHETRQIEHSGSKGSGNTAQFTNTGKIFLAIRGYGEPLEVHVNREMILGRSLPDAALNPNIDLAPYNAEDLGVSRLHTSLQREGGVIKIIDMGSTNFTYINGQRLYPQEARVLRHGDELRLGKLVIKVLFRR